MADERFMRHHYGASGYVKPSHTEGRRIVNTKWTPGPWHNVRDDFIEAENGAVVVTQVNNDLGDLADEEITANALLIAAAPELYAVLEGILQWNGSNPSSSAPGEWRELMKRAGEVLTKARGETTPPESPPVSSAR